MKARFLIGSDHFAEHRLEGVYYVDKSLLVSDILDGAKVTLLPRPRRFGKTLGMTMLKAFFEHQKPKNRMHFTGLNIESVPEAMVHFGKYPTIYLSLKDIRADHWDMAKDMLREKMAGLVDQHMDDLEGKLKPKFQEALRAISKKTAPWSDLLGSLCTLMTALYEATGQPVVVLIDEYDTPVIEARNRGYQKEMLDFLKSWLGSALKPERGEILFKAVLTGILRIAKESLFSGSNNLRVHSLLNAGVFADKFGFTEAEVHKILVDFACTEKAPEVRQWYNGYSVNGQTIYNPWSLVSYIDDLPNPPRPHWLNTASNNLVHEELAKGGLELKADLESLLRGDVLRYEINENTILDEVGKSTTNIWSFLTFCGYLRVEDPQPSVLDETILEYALSIPNAEVSKAYTGFVSKYFSELQWDQEVETFKQCFSSPETHLSYLETTLQRLVLNLVSHHDIAKQPEAVFHAFCLGLLANLRMVYEIRSNHEVGYGRANIIMRPKTPRFPVGYVIEFKSIAAGQDVEVALQEALGQIECKAYDAELLEAGVTQVYRLAMVLQGKRLRVRVELC
jgi:hypothetical protein